MSIENKVVFVTGAARGIGRAACEIMAGYGAKIIAADILKEETNETVENIKKNGGDALAVFCDVSSVASIKSAVSFAVDQYGRIDVLFNNAAVENVGSILEFQEKDWDVIINTNLKGAYFVASEVAKVMNEQGHGRIINHASIAGVQGEYASSIYCISKAGVIMLTQMLALELGQYGITAVTISPGHIKTDMLMNALSGARRCGRCYGRAILCIAHGGHPFRTIWGTCGNR